MTSPASIGVMAVESSNNSKIGAVSATYVSQATCPGSCPLRGTACYAEWGPIGIHRVRLNKEVAATGANVEELAQAEAAAILGLTGARPLRIHGVGDCTTNSGARVVAAAADAYSARHDQPAWTYTHAWRDIDRESWGRVSVLASCETPEQVAEAWEAGYAAAIVVDSHNSAQARVDAAGFRRVPCPQQTGRTLDCTTCRLCWKAETLYRERIVVEFELHGRGTTNGKKLLKVLND